MATVTGRNLCVICEKRKITYICEGCSKSFCRNHLSEHNQELRRQLDEIEDQRNLLEQNLIDQKVNSHNQPLLKQINQWETEHTNTFLHEIEIKFERLTKQLKDIRQENKFNEIILNQLKQTLKCIEDELKNQPSTISIEEDSSSSFISKIFVNISQDQSIPSIPIHATWNQNGITIAGGNSSGNNLNQLFYPLGLYVDIDETVYIADYNNNRIVRWEKNVKEGCIVVDRENNQLSRPINVIYNRKNNCLIVTHFDNKQVLQWCCQNRKFQEIIASNIACSGLAMDNHGYIYVSDRERHEVKRYKIGKKEETIVAGGNEQGDRLNQLNTPHYIYVDQQQSVYISDCNNHRIVKWVKGAKQGSVVAGGLGSGNSLAHLSDPRGIFVDQFDSLYIADSYNHRVMRWLKGAKQGDIIVGGNEAGAHANQLNCPMGLAFDHKGNLYVSDCHNHRVQKFPINLLN